MLHPAIDANAFGVMPLPWARFSILAMTMSGVYSSRNFGSIAFVPLRPGSPKISPMNNTLVGIIFLSRVFFYAFFSNHRNFNFARIGKFCFYFIGNVARKFRSEERR